MGCVEGWGTGRPSAASGGSECAEVKGEKERRERGRGGGKKKTMETNNT